MMRIRFLQAISGTEFSFAPGDVVDVPEHLEVFADGERAVEVDESMPITASYVEPTAGDADGDTDGDTAGDADGDTDGDTAGDADGDTDVVESKPARGRRR